ncbi:MAG: hypothetical protein KAZ26_19455 [Caldilineaceae bacterium]|nr:hypothetical protein [Caldilineaceae bacterium]
MADLTATPTTIGEHNLIAIVHSLPPERKAQLFAFARFLAAETAQTTDLDFFEEDANVENGYTASDAHWDDLLASENGQLALDKLADEALADIRAGKAKPMVFTKNGELAPK